ncbi:MAG: hypothetical protein NZ528_00305 [Caldilineales bacterium]|nr:hypothetical protein [Caldilineales bacterium]MDW8317045.1 hypothetical protein [Anaerolineae bacterium]
MDMDDLLKALSQGQGAQRGGERLDLGSLLGALSAGQGGGSGGGQPDLSALLGAMGGGSAGGQGGGQPDLGALLGAMGGGSPGGSAEGLGGLGSLMGMLGGGAPSGGLGMQGSGNPLVDTLVRPLAEKLGISPQAAGMVLAFLLNALLSGKLAQAGAQAKPTAGSKARASSAAGKPQPTTGAKPKSAAAAKPRPAPAGQPSTEGSMDLGSAIAGFGGSPKRATSSRSGAAGAASPLAQELSQQTGLDPQTAQRSIEEFINLLGGPDAVKRLGGR